MKRSWIGFFLLLVLLGVGIAATWGMGEVHEPVAEDLRQAASEGLRTNWEKAAFYTARARQNWDKWKLLRACLTEHEPMEDIDALFSTLQVYGACRESVGFSALCQEMAEKIEAIGAAHGLVWENLL